jgi:hypothetical protein
VSSNPTSETNKQHGGGRVDKGNSLQNCTIEGSNPSLHSKVTRYIILKSPSIDALVLEVNALLRLGWQPQGGVAKNSELYVQAMVQYNEVK